MEIYHASLEAEQSARKTTAAEQSMTPYGEKRRREEREMSASFTYSKAAEIARCAEA